MNLTEIIKKLDLETISTTPDINIEVKGGYSSDLLSDVMANVDSGFVWITLQIHPNIVAVASMKELAGIILVNGRKPDEETLKRAKAEKVNIFSTKLSAFKVAGKLYELGLGKQ